MCSEKKIKELSEANKKLEFECDSLNSQLRLLNDRILTIEKYKSNFFSNITNEIINPFTGIIGICEAMLASGKDNWEKVSSLIALVHSEAYNLDIQLKNIFYCAYLEAGEFKIANSKIKIFEFVNDIKSSFYHVAIKKEIDIEVVFPNKNIEKLYFINDVEKLKIILDNFINILIDYNYENKKVKITCQVINNSIHFKFESHDNLITIKYIKYLYKNIPGIHKISKANIYSHAIALSIIKSLLDILGGRIEFNSDDGDITINIPESSGEVHGTSETGREIFF